MVLYYYANAFLLLANFLFFYKVYFGRIIGTWRHLRFINSMLQTWENVVYFYFYAAINVIGNAVFGRYVYIGRNMWLLNLNLHGIPAKLIIKRLDPPVNAIYTTDNNKIRVDNVTDKFLPFYMYKQIDALECDEYRNNYELVYDDKSVKYKRMMSA